MKIGIMTFFRVNNFGAVLQNYALQKVLIKRGNQVETINYECDFLEKPYRIKYIKDKGLFPYLIGVFGFMTRLSRQSKFDEFRKQYLLLSEHYDNKNVKMLNGEYEFFIAGSDQIWNVSATNGDFAYFLDFVEDSTKKGSYAASFAKQTIDERWREEVKTTLLQFQMLLVREKSAKELVNSIAERDAEVVLDPTLLLSQKEWEELLVSVPQTKKYVLVYQQSITKNAIIQAKRLAKKHKLDILCIPFPIGSFARAKCKTDYAPGEWLWLIKNAEYIVTDSFHGMVFSIIFNKKFFLALAATNQQTAGRMKDLLSKCGLENRILGADTNEDSEIDYEHVNEILCQERNKSISKLYEMIEKDR